MYKQLRQWLSLLMWKPLGIPGAALSLVLISAAASVMPALFFALLLAPFPLLTFKMVLMFIDGCGVATGVILTLLYLGEDLGWWEASNY